MKYEAILHGADPKQLEEKEEIEERKDNLLFGDPKEYDHLNEAEKKALSDKMRNKFMAWAKGK